MNLLVGPTPQHMGYTTIAVNIIPIFINITIKPSKYNIARSPSMW